MNVSGLFCDLSEVVTVHIIKFCKLNLIFLQISGEQQTVSYYTQPTEKKLEKYRLIQPKIPTQTEEQESMEFPGGQI
jgi:hypothetical protein